MICVNRIAVSPILYDFISNERVNICLKDSVDWTLQPFNV